MITIHLDNSSGIPIYEQVYEHIKKEILAEQIPSFSQLPSKRKLAAHLQISVHTVENAYAQLTAEGYISSEEIRGYFVAGIEDVPKQLPTHQFAETSVYNDAEYDGYDMRTNVVDNDSFPFRIWNKLMS